MTAALAPNGNPTASSALAGVTPRLTFAGVVKSEWIKLRSLRSTWWTLGAMALTVVGMVLLLTTMVEAETAEGTGSGEAAVDPTQLPTLLPDLAGSMLAQMGVIFLIVLAVLAITGEYSSGSIRSTLTAVPGRLPVLWAKALVTGLLVAVGAAAALALGMGVGAVVLSSRGFGIGMTGTGWRMAAGAVLYVVGMAVFAMAIGALVRSSAGGISITLAVLYALPILTMMLPERFQWIGDWLPGQAGRQVAATDPLEATGGAWGGYGILLAWTALALAGAGVLLKKRDA
jgi:ABC-2 type transport system permease protein